MAKSTISMARVPGSTHPWPSLQLVRGGDEGSGQPGTDADHWGARIHQVRPRRCVNGWWLGVALGNCNFLAKINYKYCKYAHNLMEKNPEMKRIFLGGQTDKPVTIPSPFMNQQRSFTRLGFQEDWKKMLISFQLFFSHSHLDGLRSQYCSVARTGYFFGFVNA